MMAGAARAVRWFCVRTRPKSEHIAAERLLLLPGVEIYCPRIRYRRSTRRGQAWCIEAMFPGYIFARFNLTHDLKAIRYTTSVTGVVHFGSQYAEVPDEVVEGLRTQLGGDCRVFDEPLAVGSATRVTVGPLKGLDVVIREILPGRERVRVLLDFLGRAMETEIRADELAPLRAHPLRSCHPA